MIVSENYENVDGRFAYNSDAKGLSLGLAQWNDRGKVDISAKVWRHTVKMVQAIGRVALHRVLDWLFLYAGRSNIFESISFAKLYDPENSFIDR